MNRIDGSSHVELPTASQTPSLLVVIINTNPHAWAALSPSISFSATVADLLIFMNAHLAYGTGNKVGVLAAHTDRAVWLYPKSPNPGCYSANSDNASQDSEMTGVETQDNTTERRPASANKYPMFRTVETSVWSTLNALAASTSTKELPSTTLLSGALSMALSYIHKISLTFMPSNMTADGTNPGDVATAEPSLNARILVVSASDSEPAQYIPTMNAVFAASHSRIPIDTLSLVPPSTSPSGPSHPADDPATTTTTAVRPPSSSTSPSTKRQHSTFLQQAAHLTAGSFLTLHPIRSASLLAHLMLGLLPDASARQSLVAPTASDVDFRAACFCHRRVVDTGFVCSICLAIFCGPPDAGTGTGRPGGRAGVGAATAECLTCATRLSLGNYGAKPAVVARRKKKRKRGMNGTSDAGSVPHTPMPG